MDSPECAVCYSATANCTLVCKHAFCKDCVKEWYHKSDDPTCPMCRRAMYFKGMYKVAETWEKERNERRMKMYSMKHLKQYLTKKRTRTKRRTRTRRTTPTRRTTATPRRTRARGETTWSSCASGASFGRGRRRRQRRASRRAGARRGDV